jgi:ribosome-associated protein
MGLRKAAARRPGSKSTRTRSPTKAAAKQTPPPAKDETQDLAVEAASAALEKKALEPILLDLRGKSDYADYLLLLGAESERQVDAIARAVEERLHARGLRRRGIEAAGASHWLLMDFGNLIVHVFFREARAFYDLEGLWADAPRVALSPSAGRAADA